MKLELKRPLVFFDLETTGTNVTTDKIVSIATHKIDPDGTVETKKRLVNPGMPIPPEATEIHGITDADVQDAPTFAQIAKGLCAYLSGCDFGGFNCIRFDIPLLAEEFTKVGIFWPMPGYEVVDVYNIYAKFYRRTLGDAYLKYTGKVLEGAHDAAVDIAATAEIFIHQLDQHETLPRTVSELYDFCTDGKRPVDLAGKITTNEAGDYVYNFGKEKGKRLADFPKFGQWMLTADFPDNTKFWVKRILNIA